MNVAVIDKKSFPRDKVCAGWVTPAVIDTLHLDTDDYAAQHTFQPITAFVTGMLQGKSVITRYDKPVSYGIRRCEFDDYLLRRSGATVLGGEKIASMEKSKGQWTINGKYTTPILVGAGGHFCPVARHLGAKPGSSEATVSAQEIEFEMSPEQVRNCHVDAQTPELYFCRDLKGYGWVFRKQNYLNIGLGRQDNRKLTGHITEFVKWLQQENRIPADIPEKFHGHAYLLYGENDRPLIDDNVIVIGDAAGLAYSQSGEGIRPAVESALLAAQTILSCEGDYGEQNLAPYVTQLQARLGQRTNKASTSSSNSVFHKWLPAIGELALSNGWFSKHVVIDRWFLHRQQGALVVA
jgi:flavin-dependent dehydrogenase